MAKAKKTETKKAEAAAKETAAPAGTHTVVQGFHDYTGDGKDYYDVGADVSHLPANKLQTFVEAGLVKAVTAADQASQAEAVAFAKAAEKGQQAENTKQAPKG